MVVARKIVVLDLHIFYDNRINKHISTVRKHYDVYRININFFHGRKVGNTQDYPAYIFNYAPTSNQYVNGLMLTLSSFLGGTTRHLYKVLRREFVEEDDDLIFHVHDPYLLTIAMGLSRRFPGSRVVFDRHDHFETWKNRLGFSVPGIFEKLYGRRVAELIIANPGLENLPEAFSGKMVTQIPNYPLSEYFDEDAIKRKIEKLGADGKVNLAYFGALSLDFDRDIDLMLRLMAAIMRDDLKVSSTLAGRIFEPIVVGLLDAMKAEFGDRMSYLGELPYKEVIENSKLAHLGFFLMNPDKPMWSPTRPYSANKIYEYLQTGTIPIIRAIIEEPEGVRACSIFFDENSMFEQMLGEVQGLIMDKRRMMEMAYLCFKTGREYSWETVAPQYLRCYERVFESEKNAGD